MHVPTPLSTSVYMHLYSRVSHDTEYHMTLWAHICVQWRLVSVFTGSQNTVTEERHIHQGLHHSISIARLLHLSRARLGSSLQCSQWLEKQLVSYLDDKVLAWTFINAVNLTASYCAEKRTCADSYSLNKVSNCLFVHPDKILVWTLIIEVDIPLHSKA